MTVGSEVKWEGKIEVNGVSTSIAFKVFDSSGKWDFLFRKTLLETFKAVHKYKSDEITIQGKEGSTTLYNQSHIPARIQPTSQCLSTTPVCIVTDETKPNGEEELAEVIIEALKNNSNLFT